MAWYNYSMKLYNVVLVYSHDMKHILMCERARDPYKGLLNLVGGKVEPGEDFYDAAYRELQEETGISRKDISMKHLMTFQYIMTNNEVQVFVGRLNRPVVLKEEVNKLCWISADEDFFDIHKYAGEGNIGHMVEQAKIHPEWQ